MPKVSVCIDLYNYADFLPEAIDSVLRQTMEDYEIVIVDDRSTDRSWEVALTYAARDPRIVVRQNPVNLGMVRNRNVCLALARGEYVKFLHADDFLCSPFALSRLAAVLDSNPAIALAASPVQSVDVQSRPIGKQGWFSGDRVMAGVTVILRCLLEQRNLIGGPSATMFRRCLAERGFDEGFFHAADLEMWFYLLEQGAFAYVDEPLTAYRWHPRQQTVKDKDTLTQADDHRALLERYLDRSYVRFRPSTKKFLRHEAVRQTRRRCRKLGLKEEARAVLASYGRQRYWREEPECRIRRWLKKPLLHLWKAKYLSPEKQAVSSRPSSSYPFGVNVAGFLKGEYGLGESSRVFSRAVAASGLPYVLTNIDSKVHRNLDHSIHGFLNTNPYAINLMAFSFDYARRYFRDRGPRCFEGRYNAALWYWEMETFPSRFHADFDYYDEIWAPTDFCRRSFEAVSPVPVYKVPYPLFTEGDVKPDRGRFALPEEAFVFLFTFDFWSITQRKNPLGVLQAFRRASGVGDHAVLVLKSINASAHPEERFALARAADGLNVIFIDDHLNRTELAGLFASADCYVSLHRSEGLGLGMAQAMSLGQPVIATGYSGNLEFMTPENSLLVDYRMIELDETCGPYERGCRWADPDVDQAAELMHWVYSHREEAARIGERARHDVRTTLDPARCIAAIRERVAEISVLPVKAHSIFTEVVNNRKNGDDGQD